MKTKESKEAFHIAMIMAYFSVFTNEDEGGRCIGGSRGRVIFFNGRTNRNQKLVIGMDNSYVYDIANEGDSYSGWGTVGGGGGGGFF